MAERFALTSAQRQALAALVRNPETSLRVLQRAQIVYLAAQGRTIPEIAREAGTSAATARTWLARFARAGVLGLVDLQRPGPRPLYDAATRATIARVASRAPSAFGFPDPTWTLDTLHSYLQSNHGVTISRSRLHDLLRDTAIDWRSPDATAGRDRGAATTVAAAPARSSPALCRHPRPRRSPSSSRSHFTPAGRNRGNR